jgi:hypothetical protein
MHSHLMDRERHMLEVLDALGGSATTGQIRLVTSPSVHKHLFHTLSKLRDDGFVRQYARGHYALLPSGRTALKTPADMRAAS